MQRHNSKASVGSVESARGGGKKQTPTHMIIQRENSEQIFLLPITHLVNGSLTRIKLNETATFKIDMNSRKQERGVVLSLGSEDICAEQMQILSTKASDNQENFDAVLHQSNEILEKNKEKNKKNESISSNQKNMQKSTTKSTTASGKCKTVSPMNKKKSRMASGQHGELKDTSRNESMSSSDDTFDEVLSPSMAKNVSRPLTTTNNQQGRKLISTNAINRQSSVESQSDIETLGIVNKSSINKNKHQQPDDILHRIDDDLSTENMSPASFDFLSKKCNKLLKENAALQLECDRLRKENHHFKKTTIPMPDPDARQWFINVAKVFSSKSTEMDIFYHAKRLGISDPKDLISCLQDSTSKTTRQIIKLLYSSEKLMTMSGTQIPAAQRQAIRDVAEAHKGPISNHQFNEAINGVFRSKKQEAAKKNNSAGHGQRRMIENENET